MITFFKRGIVRRGDLKLRVVYLAKAHTSMIHRGQRFFIQYEGDNLIITHGPSGMRIGSENFNFKEHDRPEDTERKIKKGLDDNWNKVIQNARNARHCRYRW